MSAHLTISLLLAGLAGLVYAFPECRVAVLRFVDERWGRW